MTKAHPIPDAALEQHTAVLGTSGYGKSNAIKGAVERLLSQDKRVVIVDPTGVWWGLRLTADGKRPSPFPLVIFGGRHGDLPLEAASGERVAQVLGSATTPAILDTQLMSVAARTRFFTDFAEAILRENRGPLNLIIDEAHLFAPQSGGTGLVPALLHATNNLVALGRSAGLRIVLITQRAAKLHKDALSQATGLVIMGLIDPRDQKAAKGWLDGAPDQVRAKEIMASLSGLPIGTGWIYAPRIGVLEMAAFPLVSTFDSGRPEANADAPALKPLDVASLRAALARDDTNSEALAKALPKVQRTKNITAEIAAAEKRGYERGLEDGLRRGGMFVEDAIVDINEAIEEVQARARRQIELAVSGRWALEEDSKAAPDCLSHQERAARAAPLGDAKRRERAETSPRPLKRAVPSATKIEAAGSLGAERKPLAALAAVHPAGMTEPQWAVAAGFKRTGGTWQTYRSRLKTGGRIELRNGVYYASEDGLLALGESIVPMPSTSVELVEFWVARIPGAGPMLRHLVGVYPDGATRDELADALGMTASGGTFGTYLSRLRTAELISEPERGLVRAADSMFPEQAS